MTTDLARVRLREPVTILEVGGERPFRRRIMELGLVPGTCVRLVGVAPLGDPLELETRGARLSIRRSEAALIVVDAEPCADALAAGSAR